MNAIRSRQAAGMPNHVRRRVAEWHRLMNRGAYLDADRLRGNLMLTACDGTSTVTVTTLQAAMRRETHKRCPRCQQWLPLSGFPRNRQKRLGVGAECRRCKLARQREDRATLARYRSAGA